jgi:hypothetical protein
MSAHRQHTLPPQPFAPGAIERHVHPQRVELHRWLVRAMALMLAAMVVGLVAGLFAGNAHAAETENTTATPEQATRPALLPITVGLHLHSHHAGNGCPPPVAGQTGTVCKGWNDANHGAYLRWGNGLTVGAVRNSLYRTGVYVGWTGERTVATVAGMRVSAAITLGATSGYDRLVQDDYAGQPGKGQHTDVRCDTSGRCRQVLLRDVITPLVVPSVAVHINPRTAARLSWIHKTGADADHALHLSIEWALP